MLILTLILLIPYSLSTLFCLVPQLNLIISSFQPSTTILTYHELKSQRLAISTILKVLQKRESLKPPLGNLPVFFHPKKYDVLISVQSNSCLSLNSTSYLNLYKDIERGQFFPHKNHVLKISIKITFLSSFFRVHIYDSCNTVYHLMLYHMFS